MLNSPVFAEPIRTFDDPVFGSGDQPEARAAAERISDLLAHSDLDAFGAGRLALALAALAPGGCPEAGAAAERIVDLLARPESVPRAAELLTRALRAVRGLMRLVEWAAVLGARHRGRQ
jgi:hypothetical protein